MKSQARSDATRSLKKQKRKQEVKKGIKTRSRQCLNSYVNPSYYHIIPACSSLTDVSLMRTIHIRVKKMAKREREREENDLQNSVRFRVRSLSFSTVIDCTLDCFNKKQSTVSVFFDEMATHIQLVHSRVGTFKGPNTTLMFFTV